MKDKVSENASGTAEILLRFEKPFLTKIAAGYFLSI